jgi:hypothetical protein
MLDIELFKYMKISAQGEPAMVTAVIIVGLVLLTYLAQRVVK